MRAAEHSEGTTPYCASCGGVIGVYEPLVQVADGFVHKTSRAAEPDIARTAAGDCYHLACCDLELVE